MTHIPAKCYKAKGHTGQTLVCEERRRRMVFRKPAGCTADKIQVDGCVLPQGPACDYLVRDWKGRHHFIELKGKHDEEALKQIEATIPHFVAAGSDEKIWCFIVGSGSSPATLPGIQSRKRLIRKRWQNAEIIVRTNVHEHFLKA